MRTEKQRSGLRPDDRDGACAGHGQQTERDHQRIGKAGAGLAQFEMRSAIAQPVGSKRDIGGQRLQRRRGVADQIGDIVDLEARFGQRAGDGLRGEIWVGVAWSRGFGARFEIAAQVPGLDREPLRDGLRPTLARHREPMGDPVDQGIARRRRAGQRDAGAQHRQVTVGQPDRMRSQRHIAGGHHASKSSGNRRTARSSHTKHCRQVARAVCPLTIRRQTALLTRASSDQAPPPRVISSNRIAAQLGCVGQASG